MLQGIADFAMQGRWKSAIATALLSMAALMLPPVNYLASGVVALSTLRMGPKEGAKVVIWTVIIFALLAGLLLGQLWVSGMMLLTSWLPVYGISLVLGYTRSMAMSLLATAGLGIVVVILFHLLVADPAQWWQQMLTPFIEMLSQQPGWALSQTESETMLANLANMMTGLIAAGVAINVMLGLLIGRAWQAKLYNPGGFASEFCQLKLGKPAALLTSGILLIALSPLKDSFSLLVDCLPVVLVVFALQGLAVAHAVVRAQQKPKFWLVVIYVLLVVILPQMVVLLAILGVLEQWFNFRRHSVE